ncbi:NADPH-dependent oxidoreductase [Actinomadura sp. KC216]|uniref:NADPH-dependent FMN reductase n=1 Tax=Actinomadura sp. KC216 TaxID=2530370 RepID=UPI0010455315|nr:NAD(P)H-dependent oxidoreductase [Actinomadura sp. KC216]TDB80501.1 NADPH-dependent oxidoreductase [Actinomadura sp. KC216]
MSITVLVGNPRPGSRTSLAGVSAARAVSRLAGDDAEPHVIELAGLATHLFHRGNSSVAAAVRQVTETGLLVVASPTYKATYTGLLKAFLDRIDTGALAGTVALPLMVVGSAAHALAVEVHLRPLLVELGATVVTPGLAVEEDDVPRIEEITTAWAARVEPRLRRDAVQR